MGAISYVSLTVKRIEEIGFFHNKLRHEQHLPRFETITVMIISLETLNHTLVKNISKMDKPFTHIETLKIIKNPQILHLIYTMDL